MPRNKLSCKRIGIITYYNLDRLDSGGKLRSYNIAKELSQKGYRVFVLMPKNGYKRSFKYPFHFHQTFINTKSHLLKTIKLVLAGITFFRNKSLDYLIADFAWSIPAAFILSFIFKLKLIYNTHNIEFLRTKSTQDFFPYCYSLFIEQLLVKRCNAVCFVSREDQKLFQRYLPKRIKSILLPNGIDFHPSIEESSKYNEYNTQLKRYFNINENKLLSLFVGDLTYKPNKEALIILDKISQNTSDFTQFIAIGKFSSKSKKRTSQILYTGYLEDINQFLYGCDFSIIPITHGGGTNLKIIEALTVGLPIICTNFAFRGIKYKNNGNLLLISDDFNNYPKLILNNIEKIKTSTKNRSLATEYHWKYAIKDLNKFLSHNSS